MTYALISLSSTVKAGKVTMESSFVLCLLTFDSWEAKSVVSKESLASRTGIPSTNVSLHSVTGLVLATRDKNESSEALPFDYRPSCHLLDSSSATASFLIVMLPPPSVTQKGKNEVVPGFEPGLLEGEEVLVKIQSANRYTTQPCLVVIDTALILTLDFRLSWCNGNMDHQRARQILAPSCHRAGGVGIQTKR